MDPMKMSIEDVLKAVKEKGIKIKDRFTDEAEDLRKAWFKHMLANMEKQQEQIDALKARVEQLESHTCSCEKDKNE